MSRVLKQILLGILIIAIIAGLWWYFFYIPLEIMATANRGYFNVQIEIVVHTRPGAKVHGYVRGKILEERTADSYGKVRWEMSEGLSGGDRAITESCVWPK